MSDTPEWGYVNCRVSARHLAVVQQACEKAGCTVADYVRNLIIPWAYADRGMAAPDMSEYATHSTVMAAAKAAGMSVREYESRAAKAAAARDLGLDNTHKVSEVRKAVGIR